MSEAPCNCEHCQMWRKKFDAKLTECAHLEGEVERLSDTEVALSKELKDTQSLLNRREVTFAEERTENRRLRIAAEGQVAPIADMKTMLPEFIKMVVGGGKNLSLEKVADKLVDVKDMSGMAKVLGDILNPEEGEVAPELLTRSGFLHCPHDGLKCTHECEGNECWRELDGS